MTVCATVGVCGVLVILTGLLTAIGVAMIGVDVGGPSINACAIGAGATGAIGLGDSPGGNTSLYFCFRFAAPVGFGSRVTWPRLDIIMFTGWLGVRFVVVVIVTVFDGLSVYSPSLQHIIGGSLVIQSVWSACIWTSGAPRPPRQRH